MKRRPLLCEAVTSKEVLAVLVRSSAPSMIVCYESSLYRPFFCCRGLCRKFSAASRLMESVTSHSPPHRPRGLNKYSVQEIYMIAEEVSFSLHPGPVEKELEWMSTGAVID